MSKIHVFFLRLIIFPVAILTGCATSSVEPEAGSVRSVPLPYLTQKGLLDALVFQYQIDDGNYTNEELNMIKSSNEEILQEMQLRFGGPESLVEFKDDDREIYLGGTGLNMTVSGFVRNVLNGYQGEGGLRYERDGQ